MSAAGKICDPVKETSENTVNLKSNHRKLKQEAAVFHPTTLAAFCEGDSTRWCGQTVDEQGSVLRCFGNRNDTGFGARRRCVVAGSARGPPWAPKFHLGTPPPRA